MVMLTEAPSSSYRWYQQVVNSLPGMSSRHIPRQVSPVYDDIRLLGALLGRIIAKNRHEGSIEGPNLFLLIENLRRAAKKARHTDDGARSGQVIQETLAEGLASFPEPRHDECIRKTVGGFRLFLELAALTENYHAKFQQASNTDMVQAMADTLHCSPEHVARKLSQTSVRFVSTAHPTQVYRDTYLAHERALLNHLDAFHQSRHFHDEQQHINAIEATIETLWLTRFERWDSPSVYEEAFGLMSYLKTILDELPALVQSIETYLPEHESGISAPIQIGSWIGGDMDGNPHTNAETLGRILQTRYEKLLEFYEARLLELAPQYSYSHLTAFQLPDDFQQQLAAMLKVVSAIPEDQRPQYYYRIHQFQHREPLRQWLLMLAARLYHRRLSPCLSIGDKVDSAMAGHVYTAQQLADDLSQAIGVLARNQIHPSAFSTLKTLQQQVTFFGFHWVGIDLREEAINVQQAVNDWLADDTAPEVTSNERMAWLLNHLANTDIPPCHITASQTSSHRLMGMLTMAAKAHQQLSSSIGRHLLLSMTHHSHDVIAALVLAKWCGLPVLQGGSARTGSKPLAIVPLFETIDDLRRCESIMAELFNTPLYRHHCQNHQVVLMAYSDSNKDGGFCTSQWELFQAQKNLSALATKEGLSLQFYHGRGGSIGRGGGPTQRFVQALPSGTYQHGLQITEQGEVLTHHYLSGSHTRYHWQQYLSALIESNDNNPDNHISPSWIDVLNELSEQAYSAYTHLKHQPGFIQYFEQATPKEIDSIHIGSRPSHRRNVKSLQDLRAIPWVFRWYQSRVLLPGWYGLGSAIQAIQQNPEQWQLLQQLYQEWPFVTSLLDNAATTLLQTDTNLMAAYAQLAEPTPERDAILALLQAEYHRTTEGILAMTQSSQLLAHPNAAPIRTSFEMKQAYLDPLNYLQVHLLQQYRDESVSDERKAVIHRSLISAVGGVVAGLGVAG